LLSFSFRRVLAAIPLLLGVATLVFVALSLAPGDAASLYVRPGASPEVLDALRRQMGLDQPFLVRYGAWLFAFLRGEFGYSFFYQMPVRDRILVALPNTLVLASGSLLLAFALGGVVGVYQSVRQNTLMDSVLTGISLVFYSVPSFCLALALILFFSLGAKNWWDWPFSFPASGIESPGADLLPAVQRGLDRLHHIVLPMLTLTLILAASVSRYVRTSMLEVIRQDYIRTARAKGLSETRVILKHALRNGLIPLVSLFGVYFPFLLSGAVLVEYVFAWPGMGQLMVESIYRRDQPVVLAGSFLFGGMVILGNLLADILYGVVDPRIRDRHG